MIKTTNTVSILKKRRPLIGIFFVAMILSAAAGIAISDEAKAANQIIGYADYFTNCKWSGDNLECLLDVKPYQAFTVNGTTNHVTYLYSTITADSVFGSGVDKYYHGYAKTGITTAGYLTNFQGNKSKVYRASKATFKSKATKTLVEDNGDHTTYKYSKTISTKYKLSWYTDSNGNNEDPTASAASGPLDDPMSFTETTYKYYKLSGTAVDVNGNAISTSGGTWSSSVRYNAKATITAGTASGYKFLGWRTDKNSGTPSGGTSYSRNMTSNATMYAVYVKEYKLTISTSNAWATVNRTESKHAKAGTGNIGNNTTIYYGDKLTIAFGPNSCYKWGTHTVNSSSVNSGYTMSSVSGNVAVVASGVIKSAKLYISQGAGTTLSVTRNNVIAGNNSTIQCGDTLKATYGLNDGYSWGTHTLNGGNISSGSTYKLTDSNAETNVTIATTAIKNQYYAKSYVASTTGNWSSSNGKVLGSNADGTDNNWTQNSNTTYYNIYNCDPVAGCTVKFWHYLKRMAGSGSTNYSVTRTSNYSSISSGTVISARSQNFAGGNEIKVREEAFERKMKPGQTVCETLTFDANVDAKNRTLKVCALALGNAQPNDPNPDTPENPNTNSGDTSFVNIKVRNQNVTKYSNYQREVYAKPGDTLTYRATYYPVLQYTYSLVPEKMQINGGGIINGNGSTLGTLFNNNKGSLSNWNNGFNVQRTRDGFNKNIDKVDTSKNSPGVVTRQQKANNQVVGADDVGKSIDERAITNADGSAYNDAKTTPGQVTFTNNGNKNLGNVSTASRNRVAYARIPYNFIINTEIKTTDDIIYAGEETDISFSADVNPKANDITTNGTAAEAYATKARDVRRKLVVYDPNVIGEQSGRVINNAGRDANICAYFGYNGSDERICGYVGDKTEELNAGPHTIETKFYAQDARAGSRVCVASAVFPADSGANTNWQNKNGSNSWRISQSKCFTIAKKPSLQVWGGNLYSAGNITTSVAKKTYVAGINDSNYRVSGQNGHYVFGTWDELGIMMFGKINSGVASGAGTGYSGEGLFANPGGNYEDKVSICLRSTLTFANYVCTGTDAVPDGLKDNSIINSSSNTNVASDKSKIIANFAQGGEDHKISGNTLDDFDSCKVNAIGAHYCYKDGDNGNLTIGRDDGSNWNSITATSGNTYIVSARNITINRDLIYGVTDNGNYAKLDDIPKLAIYAKGNIYIDCGVNRIDAILIADEAVVTCGDIGMGTKVSDIESNAKNGINEEKNSRPLRINGTVIAGRLIANRTYGAATGTNSIIPAETINYDSTLYLWGTHKADITTSGKINVTYTKELAPRY